MENLQYFLNNFGIQVLHLPLEIIHVYPLFPECSAGSNSLTNHHKTYMHQMYLCMVTRLCSVLFNIR